MPPDGTITEGVLHNPGRDTLERMNAKPWRERVRLEDELLEQLAAQTSQAAKRRAAALVEGVTELGSVYAVAKDIGKSWTAVDSAIKKHMPTDKGPTTTE